MSTTPPLKLAFILSATDKMSRIVDEAVRKSTDKLSSFERTTSRIGRSAIKAGSMMMGAGAAIGGGMFALSKANADYAGDMYDMARSTGVGVESFQEIAYAAKMSGIETEKISASFVKFDKMITGAAGGNKTYMKTFEDLGIKIKDSAGNLRKPNEIFDDVADIFHNVEDGAGKTALACEFFGKTGADLIPMLNDGKDGLQEFYKAARESGNVLTKEGVLAADVYGDKLEQIGLDAKGAAIQLGATFIPVLSELVTKADNVIGKVTAWIKQNPQLTENIAKTAAVSAGFLIVLGAISVLFGSLTFIVGQFGKVFRAVSVAIKIGTAIMSECKNGMLLFRIQYAALVVQEKLAAAATWLFNKALFGCPIIWIIAGITAVVLAAIWLVKNWESVSSFFMRLWDNIKRIFGRAWDAIKTIFLNYTPTGLVLKHWDKIADFFGKLWERVKNGISTAWEAIKMLFFGYTPLGILLNHWQDLPQIFSIIWNKVKEVTIQAWDSISGFFANLGTRFFDWGKNLITSLWGGIKSAVSNVIEGVKGVAAKIATAFKSFFGINSPSRLFAEYGVNLTQGLVVGIDKGIPSVEKAAKGIASGTNSGITKNLQTDISNFFGGSSSGVSLNYSPQITINGTVSQETKEEFSKMLKQHANEIVAIIRRDAENTKRLSFNV